MGISCLVYQRWAAGQKRCPSWHRHRARWMIGLHAETNRTGLQTILTFLVEASITGAAQIALWSLRIIPPCIVPFISVEWRNKGYRVRRASHLQLSQRLSPINLMLMAARPCQRFISVRSGHGKFRRAFSLPLNHKGKIV